jgi:hypothetical protein
MRKIRVGLAAADAVALALTGSTTANADELSDTDAGDIVMMYEVDGQLFPAEPVYPPPKKKRTATGRHRPHPTLSFLT